MPLRRRNASNPQTSEREALGGERIVSARARASVYAVDLCSASSHLIFCCALFRFRIGLRCGTASDASYDWTCIQERLRVKSPSISLLRPFGRAKGNGLQKASVHFSFATAARGPHRDLKVSVRIEYAARVRCAATNDTPLRQASGEESVARHTHRANTIIH